MKIFNIFTRAILMIINLFISVVVIGYGGIARHCSFTSFDTSQNVDLKIFAFHNLIKALT